MADPVDSYYASRREHGVVVTLSCKKPTETCFCKAFGIDATNPGGDVACWMTDDELLLQANTEKGEALLASLSLLEDAADNAADSEKEKLQTILDKLPLGNLSTESFGGDKLMALFNSDKWESLSESCLACGTCTFVCPTCQCYDIRDYDTGHGVQRSVVGIAVCIRTLPCVHMVTPVIHRCSGSVSGLCISWFIIQQIITVYLVVSAAADA